MYIYTIDGRAEPCNMIFANAFAKEMKRLGFKPFIIFMAEVFEDLLEEQVLNHRMTVEQKEDILESFDSLQTRTDYHHQLCSAVRDKMEKLSDDYDCFIVPDIIIVAESEFFHYYTETDGGASIGFRHRDMPLNLSKSYFDSLYDYLSPSNFDYTIKNMTDDSVKEAAKAIAEQEKRYGGSSI